MIQSTISKMMIILVTVLLASCSTIPVEQVADVAGTTVPSSPTDTPVETDASVNLPVVDEGDDPFPETATLRKAVSADGIGQHLQAFQDIADANGDIRASGTPGYDASADYVKTQLEAAGYEVTVQPFEFRYFQDASSLAQIRPLPTVYNFFDHFASLGFSPEGQAEGVIQPVGLKEPLRGSSTSGCREADFANFVSGNIALIKRGICPFAEKAQNAESAGASAVLIFNDGADPDRNGVVRGTLGEDYEGQIPVLGLSFDLGETLYRQTLTNEVMITLQTKIYDEMQNTVNVIADTPAGRDDFVVLVGGHLDSVPAGPGIQDNGSGTAAILEIALQMAELGIEPRNKVRFAFWGAEEFGLIGSTHYVEELSRAERQNIALNLNFDMIASPNYALFVYDGDHSAFSPNDEDARAPKGSAAIEQIFHDYFESQNINLAETAFDGRSDYGPFIAVGIPAGGLFTGAESDKPASQLPLYGGTAGEAYDACYHLACDTIANINWEALAETADAAAHTVLIFAMADKPVAEVTSEE